MRKLFTTKRFALVFNLDKFLFGITFSEDIRGTIPYFYKYLDVYVGPFQFVWILNIRKVPSL